MFMSSFDFESKTLFDGFQEIEEGVYFKHYGIELPPNEEIQDAHGVNSFGEFEAKSLLWQIQIDMNFESIALKSVIGNSLCGFTVSQADIAAESLNRGWFNPNCGSSFDDLIELLKWDVSKNKDYPLTVDVISNGNLTELTEYVDSSDEVICYVNKMLLEQEGDYCYPGLNADGLVHIIGISFSNDGGDFVIVNDTSSDSGAGKKIVLESFLNAWATSNYTAITISRRCG